MIAKALVCKYPILFLILETVLQRETIKILKKSAEKRGTVE